MHKISMYILIAGIGGNGNTVLRNSCVSTIVIITMAAVILGF